MATTTPVTTPTGADPFAGAPGAASPGATPTDPSVSTAGMPTFTGGSSAGQTFGGMPTSLFPTEITIPGVHPPGLSREDQTGRTTIPAYGSGDEWAPSQDPNPDNTRTLQIQLVEAGLLKASDVHYGIWDQASAKAYAKVLAHANVSGINATTALDQYVKAGALPQKQINADDLNAMAQQIAENTLGRKLNAEQLTRFTTAFQSAIAHTPDGGPTTSAGIDLMGSRILAQEHPQEAHAESLHNVSKRALSILTTPAVSLPGVQT